MSDFSRQTILFALWAGLCAWAIARGRAPERLHGAAHLLGGVLTPLVQYRINQEGAEMGVFAIDMAILLLALYVALKWDRWWAMFAAAFLLLQAATHVVRIFNLAADQFYYASAAMFWSFASLFAMAVGVGQIEWERYRDQRMAPA